jgi:cation transport protein ChaC
MTPEAFVHHPELQGRIIDPMASFARTLHIPALAKRLRSQGLPVHWIHDEATREADRHATLAGRRDADLWVFAYGSLMWDPGFRFDALRRAHVPDHARRFILRDIYGGRGTPESPGLMAALDRGPGCDGLLFRIPAEALEEETMILWRRERIGRAYTAAFVTAHHAAGAVEALTFVADHEAELIAPDLTPAEQVRYLATGTGFLGSSLDYLRNVCAQCERLGIEDAEIAGLLREVEAYLATR